jgi:hypothetical protein
VATLHPDIYCVLICSHVERDADTLAWRMMPLSHLAVRSLPYTVQATIFVGIMAQPGTYQLRLRINHVDDPEPTILLQPIQIPVQPERNVEYLVRVGLTLHNAGLYILEAMLVGYDTAYCPLRVSLASST